MKKIGVSVFSVIALSVAVFAWSFCGTHQSLTTSRVDQRFNLTAKAPYGIIWGIGSAYALLLGEINGTATVEIIGNQKRDRVEFTVGPGSVEIARGGPEEWIGDYSIRYTPLTATSGSIYASVYCGEGMSEADRTLYHEILGRK
ncbi:MAG: hypothetical protein AAFY98_00320 [Verrucomicrobiota bacterium]